MADPGAPHDEPSWVSLGDVRVPYLEVGDPAGRPVVLVPGLTDGIAPVTEPRTRALLADVPLPILRYRGLAMSHRFPAEVVFTTRDLATDLAAALDVLLDEPAVLVCHSMGGMVAQHLAADRPDLVAAMILSATVPQADTVLRRVLADWARVVRVGDATAYAQLAIAASYTGRERDLRAALVVADPPPPLPAEAIARHLALSHACATHDALDRLAAIRAPTLVLAGEHDHVAPPHQGERLADGIADATFEVLAGLAHGFPEQDPEGFTTRATRFLDTHGRTTGDG
jgi:pimeloyl-ACP methyl ester carboxylesterase